MLLLLAGWQSQQRAASVGLAAAGRFTTVYAVFFDVEVHGERQKGDHVDEQQLAEEFRVWRRVEAICGLRRKEGQSARVGL